MSRIPRGRFVAWLALAACSREGPTPGIVLRLPTTPNETGDSADTSPPVTSTWYRDADFDGFGTASDTAETAEQPGGYVAEPGDCDDADPSVHPGATETCDGVDDDCDGELDEDLANRTWYGDSDGDGYGDPTLQAEGCAPPDGYCADSTDCDDGDYGVNPGASEVLGNGADDDCDGVLGHSRIEGDLAFVNAEGWVLGEGEGDKAGHVVAARGDLDGDGRADPVVPIPRASDEVGSVYVFSGPLLGPSGAANALAAVEASGDANYVGGMVATGDDLDSDGYGDLRLRWRQDDEDSIFVFHGPLSGSVPSDEWDAQLRDVEPPNLDGYTGDLNGDGIGDTLFGSTAWQGVPETGDPWAGSALLFLGPITGTRNLADADAQIFVRSGCSDSSHCGPGVGWSVSTGDVGRLAESRRVGPDRWLLRLLCWRLRRRWARGRADRRVRSRGSGRRRCLDVPRAVQWRPFALRGRFFAGGPAGRVWTRHLGRARQRPRRRRL